jgi:hypothetical protein
MYKDVLCQIRFSRYIRRFQRRDTRKPADFCWFLSSGVKDGAYRENDVAVLSIYYHDCVTSERF